MIAFIISMLYCHRKFNPSYLRIFTMYLFVSVALETVANTLWGSLFNFYPFGSHQVQATYTIYNLFTFFELCIFAWFLMQVIRSSLVKRLLIVLVILFTVSYFLYYLKTGLGEQLNLVSVVMESTIIIIPCLTYFLELFTNQEPVELLKEPSFWLVTGIFFYLATIIPLCVTSGYMNSHGLKNAADILYSINNLALIVTYLLFIKGFTCRVKKS